MSAAVSRRTAAFFDESRRAIEAAQDRVVDVDRARPDPHALGPGQERVELAPRPAASGSRRATRREADVVATSYAASTRRR